jgi:hypothetical protein
VGLRDEDREAIAEEIAAMLVFALERQAERRQ